MTTLPLHHRVAPPCTRQQTFLGLKGLIFDCDGVLFDSKEANTAFYNHIRRLVGLPPMTREEENYAHMASTEEALARTIPPHLLDAAIRARRAVRYSAHFMPMMVPVPQMCIVLEHLQSWGLRLALCTNRTDSVCRVLEHFELTRFFSPVMTVSRAAPKPDPEGLLRILDEWEMKADDVAYVGDSLVDEQAARRARIPFWSFGNQELHAALYLSGFEELFSLVSPLLDTFRE
jgi:phosphoglycolate phosphatase-like HAD superfamily hydrolase